LRVVAHALSVLILIDHRTEPMVWCGRFRCGGFLFGMTDSIIILSLSLYLPPLLYITVYWYINWKVGAHIFARTCSLVNAYERGRPLGNIANDMLLVTRLAQAQDYDLVISPMKRVPPMAPAVSACLRCGLPYTDYLMILIPALALTLIFFCGLTIALVNDPAWVGYVVLACNHIHEQCLFCDISSNVFDCG